MLHSIICSIPNPSSIYYTQYFQSIFTSHIESIHIVRELQYCEMTNAWDYQKADITLLKGCNASILYSFTIHLVLGTQF